MAVPLLGGVSGIPRSAFGASVGTCPSRTPSSLTYAFTQISPTSLSDLDAWAVLANANGFRFLVNFAGPRNSWTDPGTGALTGKKIYNPSKYKANVLQFASAAAGGTNTRTAIDNGLFQGFTVDEPTIAEFAGSISSNQQNDMGLLLKATFGPINCVQRSKASTMTPIPSASEWYPSQPVSSWSGLDYGVVQMNRGAVSGGANATQRRSYFATEKANLLAISLGMIPALNWINGGDGRNWDYLNNGSSVGRIEGDDGPGFWLAAPDELMETADAVFDDPDAIGYMGYTYCDSSFVPAFLPYQVRQDFICARVYQQNKFATRPSANPLRTPKPAPGVVVTTGLAQRKTRSSLGTKTATRKAV